MTPPLMATYDRLDVAFTHGAGARLYSEDGRTFLDFAAGVAVNVLGHCHPHLVDSLCRQAEKLWHCSNLYRIREQERLAQRLVDTSFADAAFFCNSGAEAIECTIKLARKHQHAIGRPERYRMIVFEGAFHGRTLAAVAAGASAKHRDGFGPAMDGFDRVPFNDLAAAEAACGEATAGILVEPIQGEGGIHLAAPEFLRGLRALADKHGLVLCFDEVQCGFGRTGRLFAHEWADVKPDVMALAKGLGGGFPIGACVATASVAAALTPGSHGSTFGGNPLACAVANAVLDVIHDENFLARVRSLGALMHQRLARLPGLFPGVITDVRGLGLMLGLKCAPANRSVVECLFANGLLTVPAADNVVRLLPPLTIDVAEIEEAAGMIELTCAQLAEKAA
ncbi:Acetylornithine aminotransferase [Candidatus Defluviicoccus seviourii]|uniref:Acetylornithine aminotransferase n=1 Tax=Candidatus Defluviicoccus seviourii TaxID=2565273 RepID=A0A564WEN1_9PROT|nr:Acetylornithine aminotransferase [Candidatus Defluviicoccus seviourii]